jgi:ribosomal protein S18 acetylase RimI-like enzyme
MSAPLRIRIFSAEDEAAVVDLWRRCGLTRPWNDPHQDIRRKQQVQPEGFLVAEEEGGVIVGSVMAGYDGHRGWINYLAVSPERRRCGIGRRLMADAERRLLAGGCPKINLQVRAGNAEAQAFYERLGYAAEALVSMGKRLIRDDG